jgi:hypothetical protein
MGYRQMVLDLRAGWLHRHNLQVREGTEVEVEASGETSGGERDGTEGPNAETVVKQKEMRMHPGAMHPWAIVIDYGECEGTSTAGQIAVKFHLLILTCFRSFYVSPMPWKFWQIPLREGN